MRIPLLALIGLTALAVPATAEDFTGFYAGVNAGYGFETGGRDRRGVAPGLPSDEAGSSADRGLPPSARSAAGALRSRDRATPGASPLPR